MNQEDAKTEKGAATRSWSRPPGKPHVREESHLRADRRLELDSIEDSLQPFGEAYEPFTLPTLEEAQPWLTLDAVAWAFGGGLAAFVFVVLPVWLLIG